MPLAAELQGARMTLDLNDPASIAAWYAVWPERHGPQLRVFAKLAPQFRDAIKRAGEMLRERKQGER